MHELNSLMQKIKTRLKPSLLKVHFDARKKMMLGFAACLISSIFAFSILSFLGPHSYFNGLLSITGLTTAMTSFLCLLFVIAFHMDYKKLLKNEWTGKVIDETPELAGEAQQLTKEELKDLFSLDLPLEIFKYIDAAIREKGFITHDDFYEMLQYEKKEEAAREHYITLVETLIDADAKQEENLKNLLSFNNTKPHYKTFNSKKVL